MTRREDGARRDGLPAADRRVRDARGRLAGARARPGRATCRCSSRRAGLSRSPTAWCRSDRTMMTGAPGIFAGGDMVPAERTVTVAIGHGKKAARNIDAWLRGTRYVPAPRAPGLATLRAAEHLVLRGRAADGAAAARGRPPRSRASTRSSAGLDETTALFEARRCLSCGNCFECDNCYGVCPDNAVIKLGPGERLRVRPGLLQGLRHLRRRMPVRRDRDAARAHLTGSGRAYGCARSAPSAARVPGAGHPPGTPGSRPRPRRA